jgi:cysteine-rich CWC protein
MVSRHNEAKDDVGLPQHEHPPHRADKAESVPAALERRICPGCGQSFSCCRDAPEGCWCAQLEPIGEARLRSLGDLGPRCLCPGCLASLVRDASET